MRFLVPALVLLVSSLIGHFGALYLVPGQIMSAAMERMEAAGVGLHSFTLAPRATPQTQSVVRPSPDLAYSICRFDLSDGQSLKISVAPYPVYNSVSFFDARTNNFATVRVGEGDDLRAGSEILLHAPGTGARNIDGQVDQQIEAPTTRGLILIRRLAPSPADYARIVAIAGEDRCEVMGDG